MARMTTTTKPLSQQPQAVYRRAKRLERRLCGGCMGKPDFMMDWGVKNGNQIPICYECAARLRPIDGLMPPMCKARCGKEYATVNKHLRNLRYRELNGIEIDPLCQECWEAQQRDKAMLDQVA